ncbi:MAG: nicotinate-nucleotide adenylyltransferase [Anaerolineales bacterium]
MTQIGIFGGTFDPPHLGHLILGAEALYQLRLERLLWMLTPQPPHKPGQEISDSQTRLTMLRLAIEDEPRFEVSRIEIERPGPHYTIDSLRLLQAQFPQAELIFLMGGDSLRDLPGWRDPAAILAACRLGVMRRPGDQIDLTALEARLPGAAQRVQFLDAPLLEISSREIRQRVRENAAFRYYLPPKVYDYIQQNRLYR